MVAQVLKYRRKLLAALFCAVAISLASCASQKDSVRLVDDPVDAAVSALPGGRRGKWETPRGPRGPGPRASSGPRNEPADAGENKEPGERGPQFPDNPSPR